MKYSILVPFFNRAKEFRLSLESYNHWYGDRKDVEILVGEDPKNTDCILPLVGQYPRLNIRVVNDCGHEACFCPAPIFNRLAEEAAGEVFILTNPESVHMTNILDWIDRNYPVLSSYLIFACEAGIVADSNQAFPLKYQHHLWYQHSEHNNRMLHFCSAIPRNMYYGVGGFDESYARGIAYDDNDFIQKIRVLGIPCVAVDDQRTVHVEHDRSYISDSSKILLNREYYMKKWRREIA